MILMCGPAFGDGLEGSRKHDIPLSGMACSPARASVPAERRGLPGVGGE